MTPNGEGMTPDELLKDIVFSDLPRELRDNIVREIERYQKQESERQEWAEFKSQTLYMLKCLENKA